MVPKRTVIKGFRIAREDDESALPASPEGEFPDNVLFQLIETTYSPALGWEDCLAPMHDQEFIAHIQNNFPGKFEDAERTRSLLTQLHYKYAFNEFNQKYYWLVNFVAV